MCLANGAFPVGVEHGLLQVHLDRSEVGLTKGPGLFLLPIKAALTPTHSNVVAGARCLAHSAVQGPPAAVEGAPTTIINGCACNRTWARPAERILAPTSCLTRPVRARCTRPTACNILVHRMQRFNRTLSGNGAHPTASEHLLPSLHRDASATNSHRAGVRFTIQNIQDL